MEMIFKKPAQKKTSASSRRNAFKPLFLIFICRGLVAPLELYCQEINHIQVEHVLDIRGDFNQPTEVVVGKKGRIYVLDGANNQVKVFSPEGKFVRAFGSFGKRDGELHYPVGIDIDEQENVYVADTGNRRIQIFDGMGRYVRKIDLSPWKARPVAVKGNKGSGLVYVSDADNHQILCFQRDGSFNVSWGDLGEQPGEFRFPGMTAVDPYGDVYVVDILNGRVQIFSALGKNPRQIGELGVLSGQLFRPKGIAIDDRSFIYVSDSYTGLIQVFDKAGKLHGILSVEADTLLRLTTPLGLAFDSNRRLYVVQSTLNKVSVFIFHDK